MYALAEAEDNRAVQGVAIVMEALAFQTLADAFGDVPVFEVNQGGAIPFPAYNTQAEAYGEVLSLLTRANALLDGTGEISAKQDLMYGGNISKWKKLAASVKFRA